MGEFNATDPDDPEGDGEYAFSLVGGEGSEHNDLFEIDDATCEIGQYDIKLNGDYKIIVMSIDE